MLTFFHGSYLGWKSNQTKELVAQKVEWPKIVFKRPGVDFREDLGLVLT